MATRARHRASRPVTTGANTRTRAHARRCCDTLAALSEPWLASANAKRSLLGHEPSMLAAASKRHDTTPLPTTNKLYHSLAPFGWFARAATSITLSLSYTRSTPRRRMPVLVGGSRRGGRRDGIHGVRDAAPLGQQGRHTRRSSALIGRSRTLRQSQHQESLLRT